jgi:glycerophosphoryl diester phosphodiesterase
VNTLLSLARVAAIAHRGGSKLRPENTLVAFDHAVALGVDAIECDVHLSRDGEVVVIHDPTLERTTDGHGAVSALTAVELGRVDAGAQFGAESGRPFRGQGIGVPTLHTVLDRYAAMPVVIEIKGEDLLLAEAVLSLLRAHRAEGRVLIGGFSHAVLTYVRKALPGLPTSASSLEARRALTRSYFWLPPKVSGYQLIQMPFRFRGRQVFRRGFVAAARRGNVPVQAWVVDEPEEMRRLIDWGVAGIISDRPDLAVAVTRTRPEATGPRP